MSAAEDISLRTKLISSGQTDPLSEIIAQMTSTFRDAVRSSGKNRLSEDDALVPEGAIFYLVPLIRQRLLGRFGIAGEVSEIRMEEYKAAEKYMSEVRRGLSLVENPFKSEDAPQVIPTPSISENPKRFRWADQDGI
jgi:hypothetical protein